MLGRAAVIKFQGTELEDKPLHIRIEHILDIVFLRVGFTRIEVDIC